MRYSDSCMSFIPSDSDWIAAHYIEVPQKTIAACGPLRGRRILDVGCGDMLSDFGLLNAGADTVIGLDLYDNIDLPAIHHRLLNQGHQPPPNYTHQLIYQSYNGRDFPFADESFEIVFCWGVLEHIADVPRVLEEMYRVLSPDGLALIVVYPWYPCLYGSHLSDFIEEPFFHLKWDHQSIRNRLDEFILTHPDRKGLIDYLWSEFATLNHYSASRFHEDLRKTNFVVRRCELTTFPQDLVGLPADVSSLDAMICGSQLVLGKNSAAKHPPQPVHEESTKELLPKMPTPPQTVTAPANFSMLNASELPLPPLPLRQMVSPIVEESYYDNPSGDFIWGPLDMGPLKPGQAYERIFDFGCGCGREARRLLLQRQKPKSYVGLDVSRVMIEWCQKNLALDGFQFHHHDVWSGSYAPENTRNRYLPIATLGSGFSVVEANSVFTHLHDDQTRFYLEQMRSMLAPTGIIRASWFFFNKQCFPMMADELNTIFVSELDTTYAVYYDWLYFVRLTRSLGYRIIRTDWAQLLGFHNIIYLGLDEEFTDLGDALPPGTSVLGY
jgi:SAM-dependent methyltransferase